MSPFTLSPGGAIEQFYDFFDSYIKIVVFVRYKHFMKYFSKTRKDSKNRHPKFERGSSSQTL